MNDTLASCNVGSSVVLRQVARASGLGRRKFRAQNFSVEAEPPLLALRSGQDQNLLKSLKDAVCSICAEAVMELEMCSLAIHCKATRVGLGVFFLNGVLNNRGLLRSGLVSNSRTPKPFS